MKSFADERGELKFNVKENVPFEIKECVTSYNNKNVLRGLHRSPYKKLISCNKGKIFDVIVYPDGTYKSFILNENDSLLVPEHCAHGYYCFENTEIIYFFEGNYNPENEINYHYLDPVLNIQWPCDNPCVSKKDDNNGPFLEVKYLVLGSNGFLGGQLMKYLPSEKVFGINERLENISKLEKIFKVLKPQFVLCAAGISGKPTIDWCEENKEETTFVNLTCQLMLINLCKKLNIHLTILGSGGVYNGHQKFTEKDIPNYHDKFYSHTRILLEDVIQSSYANDVLYLRILYPISNDGNPKCFLSKLKTRVNSIHDVDVCITVVPSLFRELPKLLEKNITGILNFVNEGSIKLNEILDIFDIKYNLTKFDNTRGKCILDTTELAKHIKVENVFHSIKNGSEH